MITEKQYQAKYYAENKVQIRKVRDVYYGTPEGRVWRLVASAKSRAKRKGLAFDIQPSDLAPFPTHCPVLGLELDYGNKTRRLPTPNSASIDRIDNTKGYVKGNVRIISWRANRLRADGTPTELMLIAQDSAKGVANDDNGSQKAT